LIFAEAADVAEGDLGEEVERIEGDGESGNAVSKVGVWIALPLLLEADDPLFVAEEARLCILDRSEAREVSGGGARRGT
jgi:hypothetical protein